MKIKRMLAGWIAAITPGLYVRLSYFHNRGRWPNLRLPKNLSEIVLSSIVHNNVRKLSIYVDKIKVREFYSALGYECHVPKLFGVWSDVNEIDFDSLPESFALKTNHGCGNHYICPDKASLDIRRAKETLRLALRTDYGAVERQYDGIVPKVYCEEYISDGTGLLPSDYKFLCLDGQIKCILVVTERSGHKYRLLTYDRDWKELDYVTEPYKAGRQFPKPRNLPQMLTIAAKIAQHFEFVRVDFYDAKDRLILGELTFTPQGGIMSYFTYKAIVEMGRR